MEALLEVVTALLQILCLCHEEVRSENHAVTYNVDLTTLENARGDAAQHVLLAFELQGMSCVRTSLKTSNYIILRSKDVYDLSLSLIAPLETEEDIYFSFIHKKSNVLIRLFFVFVLYCHPLTLFLQLAG